MYQKKKTSQIIAVFALFAILLTSCDLSETESNDLANDWQSLKNDVEDLGNEIKAVGGEIYDSLNNHQSELSDPPKTDSSMEAAVSSTLSEELTPAEPEEPVQKVETALIEKSVERFWIGCYSDSNLLFSTYDVEILLDGESLSVLQNGESWNAEFPVSPGNHELVARKKGENDTSDSYNFTVTENSVLTAKIRHNSQGVTIYDQLLTSGMDRVEGPAPDVTGMMLDSAFELLKSEGFSGCYATCGQKTIHSWSSDSKEYLVTKQSVASGTVCKKADDFQLDCIDFEDHCSALLTGKTLAEAKEIAEYEGIDLRYRASKGGSVIQEPTENEEYWTIDKVTHNYMSEKSALLYLTYLGTPEENTVKDIAADQTALNIVELPEPPVLDPAQAELQATLSAALPLETAKEAVRIAFTNCEAMDVFTYDGMDYDQSKFHGSNYSGEFSFTVKENGNWSADSAWAWKVEDMLLVKPTYDRAVRLSCKVTCDGQNYIVYNVSYVAAKTQYVDSGDPSKTSGITTMEPNDYNPYLTIPLYLVTASTQTMEPQPLLALEQNQDDYSQDITRDFVWQEEEPAYEDIVYITPYGECWHLDPDCGGVNSFAVSASDRRALSRRPCSKCVH